MKWSYSLLKNARSTSLLLDNRYSQKVICRCIQLSFRLFRASASNDCKRDKSTEKEGALKLLNSYQERYDTRPVDLGLRTPEKEKMVTSKRRDNSTDKYYSQSPVTSSALSLLPNLSTTEKIRMLFLSSEQRPQLFSPAPPQVDGRIIKRNPSKEEKCPSSHSSCSSDEYDDSDSARDDEIKTGIDCLDEQSLTLKKSTMKKLSLRFVPYNLPNEEASGNESERKYSGLEDSERATKKHRLTFSFSERMGHVLWEMFSPTSGAGIDSDEDHFDES